MEQYVQRYLESLNSVLGTLDVKGISRVGDVLLDAYVNDKRIFVMGNGGSASTASHMACDLGKNTAQEGKRRFAVLSLNDNVAHFTAISNDISYDAIFSEQLKNTLQDGDVVIAISGSGNSPNVVKALEYARTKNARTVALVGYNGGRCKELAEVCVHVKKNDYEIVEDVHLMIQHMLTKYFKDKVKGITVASRASVPVKVSEVLSV